MVGFDTEPRPEVKETPGEDASVVTSPEDIKRIQAEQERKAAIQDAAERDQQHDAEAAEQSVDAQLDDPQLDSTVAPTSDTLSSVTPTNPASSTKEPSPDGNFDADDILKYTELRQEILDLAEGAETEDLAQRISDSGLDQEAVDALQQGLTQYGEGKIGDQIIIPSAYDIDVSIDGPLEETDDVDGMIRDIITESATILTNTANAARTIVSEIYSAFATGEFDADKIINAIRDIFGVTETAEEVVEWGDPNVEVNKRTDLHDIFDDLPRNTDIPATKDDTTQTVEFDLTGVEEKGDLPNVIRMHIYDAQLYSAFSVTDNAFNSSRALFESMDEETAQVLFQYKTTSNNWADIDDNLIENEFEVEDSVATA